MARPKSPKSRRTTMLSLTPKQLRLLTYIRDYTSGHGYAPTMQELADEFGISKVTVFEHISSLQEKGYLKRSRHKARSLQLNAGYEFPDEKPTRLPLVGRIAAGRPIEAVEDRATLDLDTMFVSRYPIFVLQVRGDSMIGDNICDGDYVICEQRQTADNGEIAVALVDGEEATLKRIFRTPKGIRLQASNPAYEPIITTNVEIQGVVVGLLRRF